MRNLLKNVGFVFGTLFLAGVVHIAVVLLLPHLAPTDTYTRVGRFEVGQGFQVLPAATAQAAPIRMADPATVVAICRFDLDEDGAVLISGRANVAYWGLSLHNRQGAIFYTINNRAIGERPLELRVMTPDEITRFRADLPEAAEQQLLIPSAQAQGFAMVRALVPEPTARARVEAEIANLRCETVD